MMEAIRNWGYTLYTLYAIIVFIIPIPLVILFHGLIAWMPEKKRLILVYKSHRVWIGAWEFMIGMSFKVEGQENIDPDTAYVFVVNHNNMLDIVMVGSYIIHPWLSLVKKEIKRIPGVGQIISLIAISVDRSSKESRKRSLSDMVRRLKDGISILIFPEGTRNRTGNPLKKFYSGAFTVAIQAQVPIIPIVIYNTKKLQPVNKVQVRPGKGNMRILPPVSTEGLGKEDIGALQDSVYQQMYTAISEWDETFQDQQHLVENK